MALLALKREHAYADGHLDRRRHFRYVAKVIVSAYVNSGW
jgi:hypothetical protein